MTLQLRQHGTNRYLIVTPTVTRVRHVDELTFRADFLRIRGGEEVADGTHTIPAAEFSAWWGGLRKARWRIVRAEQDHKIAGTVAHSYKYVPGANESLI